MVLMVMADISTFAQCSECGSPRTYSGPSTVSTTSGYWSGSGAFSQGEIAKFSTGNSYTFSVNNSFNLGGIILTGGSTLTMDKSSQGNTAAFTITNGCIVVGAGSTLNLIYFNEMSNVSVCIEDGGTVNFDSRTQSGDRDIFGFEGVTINLQGPNATLNFGAADIEVDPTNGILIEGWTGSELCDGLTAPTSGTSGNITWTSETIDICDIINARVLPIELLEFKGIFQSSNRSSLLEWTTAKEWENSHFEIERSLNDVSNWETIGIVKGQGYSDQPLSYSYTDYNLPLASGVAYYRIKQVDFSGENTSSFTISIQYSKKSGTNPWVLYPNPSKSNQSIHLELKDLETWNGEPIYLKISNSRGIGETKILQNPSEVSFYITEFFSNYGSGMYFMDLVWADNSQRIKILRNH